MNTKFNIQGSMVNAVLFLVLGFLILNFPFAAPADAMLTATANHDHISIDFFYHGSTVSIKGESDADADLVIKITSPEGHQILKQKGKVGGTVWMNVGQLKFEHTPNFYGLHSTKKVDEILNAEEMSRHVIGYPSLEKHVEIMPVANDREKARWFGEFVKFQEASKLYSYSHGNIITKSIGNNRQEYSIIADWPYQAAPGEYLVTVYVVKHGKVVEQAESQVKVEQVGTVKMLANMANNNGAIYGLLSIGIALTAGFGVGLVFRKGGGSH